MRLRIRSTLMFAIVALMACSLSAVSAVVLFRHLAVVQTVADREIEQAASDVGTPGFAFSREWSRGARQGEVFHRASGCCPDRYRAHD